MEYTKRKEALVFFSLIILGCFVSHAKGRGIDEVLAASPSVLQDDRAQCAYGGHLWCCINGGHRPAACYSSQGDCVRHCKG
ncbi:hypothetical protein BS78_02G059200 [Paspalum vaginatum]|nr:hypothetical protein BS78_02G059200 [Paspalum vaginatum]